MSDSCRPIPELSLNGFDSVRDNLSCSTDQASRKLYEAVQNKVVLVETGNTPSPRPDPDSKVGSGFFVGDGTEAVTNAHVATLGSYLDVIMNDGTRHHAEIEKLDDINDLALLKIPDLRPDRNRAVSLANANLKEGNEILAVGHPDGYPDAVMSQGTYLGKTSLASALNDPKQYPDLLPIVELTNSKDKALAQDAKNYLAGERLQSRIDIHHGNSGSVVLSTETGQLAGVVADKVDPIHALIVPADKVNALVAGGDSKFSFNYQTADNGNFHLTGIKRKDGRTGGPISLDSAVG